MDHENVLKNYNFLTKMIKRNSTEKKFNQTQRTKNQKRETEKNISRETLSFILRSSVQKKLNKSNLDKVKNILETHPYLKNRCEKFKLAYSNLVKRIKKNPQNLQNILKHENSDILEKLGGGDIGERCVTVLNKR